MKNFIQKGDTIYAIAPTGGITSGEGHLFGSMFGVAAVDAAAGETFALDVVGVFKLPKAAATTGAAWTFGEAIYWDVSEKKCTGVASGNTKIGVAVKAATSTATEGEVRLNGSF